MIDLIAVGLPNYISDKIDRNKLEETENLFNEIRSLEHLIKTKTLDKKEKAYLEKRERKIEEKKPCKICEKERKGERYHPESSCWFRNNEKKTINQVKTVNNSQLEIELNKENLKN